MLNVGRGGPNGINHAKKLRDALGRGLCFCFWLSKR